MIGHVAAPPPPVIVSPGPYQASFGAISGRVGRRVVRVVVRVDGHLWATQKPRRRHFSFHLRLPPGRELSIRVTALDRRGRSASTSVHPILGLPAAAAPRYVRSYRDGRLTALVDKLVRQFSGTCAVFVQDLRTGAGAAWNARARFSGGSTLKLAIAVQVLRKLAGRPPSPGSSIGSLMHQMLVHSDNASANQLLVFIGGSTGSGGYLVNEMLRGIGLNDTEMYGGYIVDERKTAGRRKRKPIPILASRQPGLQGGKYTTAWDLARLLRYVELAAAGKGPLARRYPSFTPPDARHLLYALAHVQDPGKIGRFLPHSAVVAHKGGWHSTIRHDNGLVFWRGGAFVVTVMTWRSYGIGTSSDVLAGRVAWYALRRFARLARLDRG